MAFVAALILELPPAIAQNGQNCFNTQFHNTASTLDMNNAYLLGYLCTMSYAQYLRFLMGTPVPKESDASVQKLFRHDDNFLNVFRNELTSFFVPSSTVATATSLNTTNLTPLNGLTVNPNLKATLNLEPAVTFLFHHKCNPDGYDPEALLISTPSTIFVVFRGTDRVDCNASSMGYQWAEWMASDFKFLKRDATFLHPSVRGQIHRGMAESLLSQNFAFDLATSIASLDTNRVTGTPKKVWITGHSLGGAHAQLFAMYLKYNFNIKAQGLYVYESPHPGDQAFINQMNTDLGKAHIQRFEFGDDPICTLPPITFGFARGGERNYFKDYSSSILNSEQTIADDAKILCALGNLPGEQIPQTAHLSFPPICPGSTCFHHPTFILKAIRHSLSASALSGFPDDVPLPFAGDNCNTGDLNKAENNDLLNNIATSVETTIANIAWSAGNIADNLLGTGVEEGRYRLVCYAFKNNPKKYLTWNGSNNTQLTISTTGTIFTLNHKDLSFCQAAGGYQLYSGSSNMAADVKFTLGVPTGQENSTGIIMKTKDDCIGDEETWYLFKVAGSSNTFVLYNINTHKVLDAPDNCMTASNACPINEFGGSSNDATQVWILEKVN